MKRYEYLAYEDAFCIRALLKAIKASGKVTHLKYVDPECEYEPVSFTVDQIEEFLNYADGALEEFKIRLYDKDCEDDGYWDDSDDCLGTFFLTLNGDYSTICDYIANDLCESIANAAEAEIDREQERRMR